LRALYKQLLKARKIHVKTVEKSFGVIEGNKGGGSSIALPYSLTLLKDVFDVFMFWNDITQIQTQWVVVVDGLPKS
jgi:hypothetical protein